ncbi:hypothetical protein SGFS_005650 [Streptomyces graminofaciens]|uniref:OmpR/PhoB-type domain-containing protein n=1 Tax=Streptomyces graminofaciens TaxID=68212 RepID=A0ABN5V8E8_9ACTN|nr:BTAD domain-containing putative transcriptional regulator [Streptomyces graminofaciens]BBC29271.1 hypothetical protein SGFS_005650 [Streptomyces graminofaciens]
MYFFVIGPLRVVADNTPLAVDGTHQRAALGMLLVQANRVVTTDRLVATLWRNDPPVTARRMVHKAVARLRGLLTDASASDAGLELVTGDGGYTLRVDAERLDSTRFFTLVRQTREAYLAGAAPAAARSLSAALALSTGPVLEDLTETGISWPELRTLEARRQTALEDLFDVALSCGRHRDVVGALESLTEPTGKRATRERLIGQCMLALYRCGRQLDALAVYRRSRVALVRRLGREPSRELSDLHRRILGQEPSLDWEPAPVPAAHGVPASR